MTKLTFPRSQKEELLICLPFKGHFLREMLTRPLKVVVSSTFNTRKACYASKGRSFPRQHIQLGVFVAN